METRVQFQVRGYELDSFGHVNNAVYLNYCEEARWRVFCASTLLTQLEQKKIFPVVIETQIRYYHELELRENFEITTNWSIEGAYIVTHHAIVSIDKMRKVARVVTKSLCVNEEKIICDVPNEFIIEVEGEYERSD